MGTINRLFTPLGSDSHLTDDEVDSLLQDGSQLFPVVRDDRSVLGSSTIEHRRGRQRGGDQLTSALLRHLPSQPGNVFSVTDTGGVTQTSTGCMREEGAGTYLHAALLISSTVQSIPYFCMFCWLE